jgi:hypothetical protein
MEDDPDRNPGGLVFEVENVSHANTSLAPLVKSKFWFPKRGEYHEGSTIYDVREIDRELPPFRAKIFTASARTLPRGYGFAWFRVFRFRTTWRARTTVRLRNASMEPLGVLRFTFELWRFRLTGKVQKPMPVTMDEMEVQKRSRGPH